MVRRSKNKRPSDKKPNSPAGKSTDPGCENTQSKPKESGKTMLGSPAKHKDSGDKPEAFAGKSSDSACGDSDNEPNHLGIGESDSPTKIKYFSDRPGLTVTKSSDHDGENAQGKPKPSGHGIQGSPAGKSSDTGHDDVKGTAGSMNEKEPADKEENTDFPNWQGLGGTTIPSHPPQGPFPVLPRLVPFPPQDVSRVSNSYEMRRIEKQLWEDPEGWDLRIVCRYGLWLVHQHILEREAPKFFKKVMQMAKTDGSQKDGKDVLTADLEDYHPAVIGGLLKFLYINDWEDMDGHPPGPTNLRSLYFHVHMAAQSWTLFFPPTVREMAVNKINRITYRLNNSIETDLAGYPLAPEGYQSVEEPLFLTIDFLYKQDDLVVMRDLMPVRAAVSRLVDVAVPWLLKQPDFVPRFQTTWSKEPVYSRWTGDHWKFRRLGCLLPSWDDPPEDADPQIWIPRLEDGGDDKALGGK